MGHFGKKIYYKTNKKKDVVADFEHSAQNSDSATFSEGSSANPPWTKNTKQNKNIRLF
jgi:hypothetical protein